jgi:hypothetical protein
MNTKDNWLTTATIHDEPRRSLWSVVFPDARVPIKSTLTCKVNVPGHQNADAYMLDLDALTDLQRHGVTIVIATRFSIPVEEVQRELWLGVPILAEGVSVQEQGKFFTLLDDDVEENIDWFEDYEED